MSAWTKERLEQMVAEMVEADLRRLSGPPPARALAEA